MINTVKLPNGMTVVTESMPHVRSVSVGLWIAAGTISETPEENGLSHFLEHMLFKGTELRTARAIAEEMDAIGGNLNAFTSKECTCYYAKVMDKHMPIALDVLSDLMLHATIDAGELEKERGVILEEIAMMEDTPEDLVHELLSDAALQGNPLAQPILGTKATVSGFSRDHLVHYKERNMRPDNTVLAVAGRFDEAQLMELADKLFAGYTGIAPQPPVGISGAFSPTLLCREKDIEQIHLCMGFPGVPMANPDVYPLSIFNNLFGGGMSSRLFQTIREESGLAYSVYSYPSSYPGCGLYTLYAGTSPKHVQAVLKLLRQEVDKVLTEGISEDVFQKAVEQLKASYILGQESASSHMSNIGRGTLLLNRVYSEDEVLARIDRTTREDVERVARQILGQPNAAAVVGKGAMKLAESSLLWR